MIMLQLTKLGGAELKRLAFLIGSNNSGTKASLAASIWRDLRAPRRILRSESPTRVLSIDMGIRNLAFCVLDFTRSRGQNAKAQSNPSVSVEQLTKTLPSTLDSTSLVSWQCLSVSSLDKSVFSPSFPVKAPSPTNTSTKPIKEAFDPATFARLACRLVTAVLLPYKPDVVLIERQRHRSGGSPSVAEWTIRVNMFECMIHAVLETLRQHEKTCTIDSSWRSPEVFSADPKRVSQFWTMEGHSDGDTNDGEVMNHITDSTGRAAKKSEKIKHAKIGVAEKWLLSGLKTSEEARKMRAAFLEMLERKRSPKARKAKANKGSNPTTIDLSSSMTMDESTPDRIDLVKLDDLADCLLQGVAWLQWEMNRSQIVQAVDMDQG